MGKVRSGIPSRTSIACTRKLARRFIKISILRQRGASALCENKTLSGVGLVDVQKLSFCDFQHAHATLCGDRRGRCAKTEVFTCLRGARNPMRRSARLMCKICVFFCDSCGTRSPLRRSAWSMCKNCGSLRLLRRARGPLRGSAWSMRCAKTGLLRFSTYPRDPLRGSAWQESGCDDARPRSYGCKKSQLLSTKVVREVRPRSSGCKVVTFKYRSSTRSTFPQLQVQSRNFQVQK